MSLSWHSWYTTGHRDRKLHDHQLILRLLKLIHSIKHHQLLYKRHGDILLLIDKLDELDKLDNFVQLLKLRELLKLDVGHELVDIDQRLSGQVFP